MCAQYGVFTKPHLTFNSVDLSSRLRSTNLTQQIEGQDDTESGDTSRTEAPGLIVNEADFEFNQDFAASGAGSVDATLSAALAARSTVTMEYRHDTASVGATNPKWTGSCFVKRYNPSGGRIGDQSIATLTLGFSTALTRATA